MENPGEKLELVQGEAMEQAVIWQERPKMREKKDRKKYKKRFRLSGSIVAKVIAFLLFSVSFFTALGGIGFWLYTEEGLGLYSNSLEEVLSDELYDEAEKMVYQVKDLLLEGNYDAAEALCAASNADMELWYIGNSNEVIWSTWDGNSADILVNCHFVFGETLSLDGRIIQSERLYLMRVYVDSEFPLEDAFREAVLPILQVHQYRYEILYAAAAGLLICILSVIFLLCGAGHRNGREGITNGVLTGIPLDVLTIVWCLIGLCIVEGALEILYEFFAPHIIYKLIYGVSISTLLAVLVMFYLIDFAIRAKKGGVLKYTVVYIVCAWCVKVLGKAAGFVWELIKRLPLVTTTALVFLAVTVLEFLGLLWMPVLSEELVLLWFLEKLVLFPFVMYVALACKKLQKAGEALAEGKENYRVDTIRLIGPFKSHGENLNSIGQGIGKAVEARMKSEHMKTELITNVSHDIKTPLTSIINYADLICEENSDNEKIAEYSEVLLRQSKRLKKLLEDLVDASKATTGNLEVNLQPCEVGVLLTQAVGEYEQKMEEQNLQLIVRQPEEEVRIMADGRHLWRVFDNLLNNICKYAQEGSRVYLSLESKGENVVVTFRNMSKYALDILPEELEERFVRGDKSRHMEGNGLGLSIAKSLVELQNGEMEIVIDGDLFKVSLRFEQLAE